MKELQRRQKVRRALYSWPSLVIILTVTFFLLKGAIKVLNKEYESAGRSRSLEEKAVALVLREKEIKADLARLQTEEGIKEEIKDRFSVTEDGEYVAIIVDEKNNAEDNEKSKWPWYKRLWNAIIGSNESRTK